MAKPVDLSSPGTARKLLHKLRNAKHVVAVWIEQLADSLSCADILCKKIGRIVEQANPNERQAVADPAKRRNGALLGMLSDAEVLVAKLERCWDDTALAQNALEGAQAAAEDLFPDGDTSAHPPLVSHALSMSASASAEWDLDQDMSDDEQEADKSQSLREVISVLQAQIRGAQELLLHPPAKRGMVDRAISTSDLPESTGSEEEAPVQLQEVVQVLQAQMRAAGEALSDRVGQVRQLERHLSMRQEPPPSPRELPSPHPDQQGVIEVLQAQVAAANEQLGQRTREAEALRLELAATKAQLLGSFGKLATGAEGSMAANIRDDRMDGDACSEHSEEGLEYHRLDDDVTVGQPDTPRSDDVMYDRDARSPPPDLSSMKVMKRVGYTLLGGEMDSRTLH